MVNLITVTKLKAMESSHTKEPIILVDDNGKIIVTAHWEYIPHNDELVYDIKKNKWCQGSEFFDVGKSHIKEIYIVKAD